MIIDTCHGRWSNHIQKQLSILCVIHGCLFYIIMVWPHETKLGLDKQVIILNIFKYFNECVDIFQLCTMSITYVTINELTHLHAWLMIEVILL